MNHINRRWHEGEQLPMMPYDTYRNYQIERARSPAEVRRADEQAARVTSALSKLFAASHSWYMLCAGHSRPWCPACLARPERLDLA